MYEGVANSAALYVLVIIGLVAILGFSFVFFRKSFKRCQEFGMGKEALARIIRSSLLFSVVPSISIVIGLFTLSAIFDIPWPWWRLILGKKLGSGIKKGAGENPGWSMVLNSTFWTAMMCVFLPLLIFGTPVEAAVLFTSAVISTVLGIIAGKMKWKWLNECNLALTLILGMLSSLAWTAILG